MTVPALPGSRTRRSTATSRRRARASASASGTSTEPADRDQALRRDRLGQRGGVLRATICDADARRARSQQVARAASHRLGRGEQLDDGVRPAQRLAHRLRRPRRGNARPSRRPLRRGEPAGRARAGRSVEKQPRSADGQAAGLGCGAAGAVGRRRPPWRPRRARRTPPASLTARSASTLRSTSTPASLRPWMNRL